MFGFSNDIMVVRVLVFGKRMSFSYEFMKKYTRKRRVKIFQKRDKKVNNLLMINSDYDTYIIFSNTKKV